MMEFCLLFTVTSFRNNYSIIKLQEGKENFGEEKVKGRLQSP